MNTEKITKFAEFSKIWEDIVDGNNDLHKFLHPTYTPGSYCIGRGDECFTDLSNFSKKDGTMREDAENNLVTIINDMPSYIKRLQQLHQSALEVYTEFTYDDVVVSDEELNKS